MSTSLTQTRRRGSRRQNPHNNNMGQNGHDTDRAVELGKKARLLACVLGEPERREPGVGVVYTYEAPAFRVEVKRKRRNVLVFRTSSGKDELVFAAYLDRPPFGLGASAKVYSAETMRDMAYQIEVFHMDAVQALANQEAEEAGQEAAPSQQDRWKLDRASSGELMIFDPEGDPIAEVIEELHGHDMPDPRGRGCLMASAPQLKEENERLRAENKRLRNALQDASGQAAEVHG